MNNRIVSILTIICCGMLFTTCSVSNKLTEIQLCRGKYNIACWEGIDIKEYELVVVKNQEQYNEIVGIPNVKINFRKNALLLVKGISPNLIGYVDSDLIEKADGNYILKVYVAQGGKIDGIEGELIIVSPANQEWILSYLVPQSISDKIELSMSYGKDYDWSYKEEYKCFNR